MRWAKSILVAMFIGFPMSAANATTYNLVGTFSPGVLTDFSFITLLSTTSPLPGGTLNGTVDISSGVLAGVNLTVDLNPYFFQFTQLEPSFSFNGGGVDLFRLLGGAVLSEELFIDLNGPIQFHVVSQGSSDNFFFDWEGSLVQTPLPATFPLFVSGLLLLFALYGKLKRPIFAVASVLAFLAPANATTYNYQGNDIPLSKSCSDASGCHPFVDQYSGPITATVVFNIDTTSLSGTFNFSDAAIDSASMNYSGFPIAALSTGFVTLAAGQVSAWELNNFAPGLGAFDVTTATTGDSVFFSNFPAALVQGSTDDPGTWANPTPLPATAFPLVTGLMALFLLGSSRRWAPLSVVLRRMGAAFVVALFGILCSYAKAQAVPLSPYAGQYVDVSLSIEGPVVGDPFYLEVFGMGAWEVGYSVVWFSENDPQPPNSTALHEGRFGGIAFFQDGNLVFINDLGPVRFFVSPFATFFSAQIEQMQAYGVGPGLVSLEVEIPQTPLPAALPLFLTGLGALGLMGWKRKRGNSALRWRKV